MPRMSIDLDEQLFDRFSVKCAKERKKKAQVIRKLIQEWVR